MAEKLAQRTSPQAEVVDAHSLEHDAFGDIIANYDKGAAEVTYGLHDDAPELAPIPELTAEQQDSLNALDFTSGDEAHSTTTEVATPAPAALAPATKPRPIAPTAPVPLTPAPAPIVHPVTPPPVAPSTEVVSTPPLVATETTPPPPAPPENIEVPPTDVTSNPAEIKVVLLDQTKDAKEAAKDAADALLTKELNEGGGFKRFLKGIWKGGVAKEYYRQKYTARAENEIRAAQDVLIHQETSAEARARATKAVLERFGYTLYEETVHKEAGERRKTEQENSPAAKETKDLIRRYVNGELTNETFAEKRSELASKYAGEVALDNLMEATEAVKGAIEHGESLDNVLQNMQVITGEVRAGSRTQARHNLTDRVMEKIASTKIGSMIPKTVIAGAVGVATAVLKIGGGKVGGVLLTFGTLGISSAVIGALREGKRSKDEQAQHNREMAMGGEIDQPATPQTRRGRLLRKLLPNRREQAEKGRERTVSASDMTSELQSKLALLESAELPDGKTREQVLQDALDALTSANVHNLITDESSRDSSLSRKERRKRAEVIEWEGHAISRETRLRLDIARAQLKVALQGQLDDPTRASLAASMNLPPTATMEDIIAHRSISVAEAIETDIDEKRAVRRKIYGRRMLLIGATTLVVGATVATGAQEVRAVIDSAIGLDNYAGVFDSKGSVSADGREHQTLLRGLFRGDKDHAHVGPNLNVWNKLPIGRNNAPWAVTGDHRMVRNNDGTYNLVDPNDKATAENFKVNDDGTMPEETRQLLESKGMRVEDAFTNTTHFEERPVSLQDYMDNHSDKTVKIKHDSWQDNDTRAFDKNEKRIHWTGTGVVPGENGQNSYHLNISNMTEGGSYHHGEHINWVEEAKAGKLAYTIHPDENSSETFLVPIAADGSIDISPDDPAAKFFVEKDGHATFIGHAAEINRLNGIDAQGRQHVDTLATMLGNDEAKNTTFLDKVPVTEEKPGYKIITNGYDTPGTFTEVPPFIPIVTRRPLENLGERRARTPERPVAPGTPERPYGAYGEYGLLTPEIIRRMEEDRMPELRRDPKARVSLKDGLDWHYSRKMDRDPAYVREIESVITGLPLMAGLTNKTKAIAPILVKGNGEEDNIYHTLSLFAQQDPAKLDQTQLLLHVNWLDSAENDPVEKAKIDKTKSEIQRALRDFPQLVPHLSQFETVWEKAKLDAGEYGDRLIGHAAQRMYDVAMFAARQAVQAGRVGDDDDMIVLKGDADALGMSRKYLTNMIDTFEAHPENDTFTGGVRWGTELSVDHPGLGFLTNFIEINRIAAQRAHIKAFQPTFGVNAGVRMSTFGAVGAIGHYADQKESAPDDLAIGERVASARNASGLAPGASGGTGYGTSVSSVLGDDHSYHRHVGGASIDTAADRFKAKYDAGESITTIWEKVNQGGHQDRRLGLVKGEKEDLKRKPMEVIGRIERNMSDLMTTWFPNEAQNAAALAVMLPGPDDLGGSGAYEIIRRPDGTKKFTFSPEGRKWLIQRLQYNANGKRDPYGERQARQLYGRRAPRGQRQSRIRPPRGRTAPMVGGLAFTS